MPTFCYTAASPSTPVPLTIKEHEELLVVNAAEAEDDEDCFSAIAAARRQAVNGRDAQRLLRLAKQGRL
jgi:hypothetical protein